MERAIAGESKVELEREMKRGAKKVIEFGTKEEGVVDRKTDCETSMKVDRVTERQRSERTKRVT